MKLAPIQPESHDRLPNQGAARVERIRSKTAPTYTGVREDRFSLVLDEAGAPASVQQAG